MSAIHALYEQAVARAQRALEQWVQAYKGRYVPPGKLADRMERHEKILDHLKRQFYGATHGRGYNAVRALAVQAGRRQNAAALREYRKRKPRNG